MVGSGRSQFLGHFDVFVLVLLFLYLVCLLVHFASLRCFGFLFAALCLFGLSYPQKAIFPAISEDFTPLSAKTPVFKILFLLSFFFLLILLGFLLLCFLGGYWSSCCSCSSSCFILILPLLLLVIFLPFPSFICSLVIVLCQSLLGFLSSLMFQVCLFWLFFICCC